MRGSAPNWPLEIAPKKNWGARFGRIYFGDPNFFLATLFPSGPGFTIPNFRFPAPFLASPGQKIDFARFVWSLESTNFKRL